MSQSPRWNPADYAQHSAAQRRWALELRGRLALRGDEDILDVGCGDGSVTADFAAAMSRGRVVGIDNSPEMIAYAAGVYPVAQHPNLAFHCMDARALTFDREFELVFSNAVLHWVDDHPAFLRGAARALRPGGRLIISCGGRGNAEQILRTFAEVTGRAPWNAYCADFRNPYFFYGPQEYAGWLPAAGLRAERLELVSKDMTHAGATGLAAWFRTTWMPITERAPEALRERLIAEAVDAYLQQFPLDAGGLAHVAMVRLEVEAIALAGA